MDGPTRKTNRTSWLALMRSRGAEDLGAELVRLATLAAATHQVEADLAADAAERSHDLDDVQELQGRSSELVAHTAATGHAGRRGLFRKEVER